MSTARIGKEKREAREMEEFTKVTNQIGLDYFAGRISEEEMVSKSRSEWIANKHLFPSSPEMDALYGSAGGFLEHEIQGAINGLIRHVETYGHHNCGVGTPHPLINYDQYEAFRKGVPGVEALTWLDMKRFECFPEITGEMVKSAWTEQGDGSEIDDKTVMKIACQASGRRVLDWNPYEPFGELVFAFEYKGRKFNVVHTFPEAFYVKERPQ
jgi:hypothetical protein